VSPGEWLQVAGAGCEIAGLGTVAWGINNTRRSFTDKPSLGVQLVGFFRRLAARFRRHKPVTIQASASLFSMSGGHARAIVKMGWEGISDSERLERLKNMVERHEDTLDRLDERLETERDERRKADEQEGRLRDETRQLLEARISDAAAGGLRLETLGVVLFALGIGCGLAGNLIA
jgi:hypothetical protein